MLVAHNWCLLLCSELECKHKWHTASQIVSWRHEQTTHISKQTNRDRQKKRTTPLHSISLCMQLHNGRKNSKLSRRVDFRFFFSTKQRQTLVHSTPTRAFFFLSQGVSRSARAVSCRLKCNRIIRTVPQSYVVEWVYSVLPVLTSFFLFQIQVLPSVINIRHRWVY